MNIRSLFFVMSVLALGACAKTTTPSSPEVPVSAPMRDITDRSACQGAPPANASLYGNPWHMQMSNGQFTIDMGFQFDQSSLTLTNTCYSAGGQSLSVSVQVPIQVSLNTIQILEPGQNSNSADFGGEQMNCNANINTGTLQYGYVGACLSINSNGQTGYLVP